MDLVARIGLNRHSDNGESFSSGWTRCGSSSRFRLEFAIHPPPIWEPFRSAVFYSPQYMGRSESQSPKKPTNTLFVGFAIVIDYDAMNFPPSNCMAD